MSEPTPLGEYGVDVLHRLQCRGKVTITADYRGTTVLFEPHWPHNMTTDVHDVRSYEGLGSRGWDGSGPDLNALLIQCEAVTRPPSYGPDEIAWKFRHRRNTRTFGPPLPTWTSWKGWEPGFERWLRCTSHQREYTGHYVALVEHVHKREREEAERRARYAAHLVTREEVGR